MAGERRCKATWGSHQGKESGVGPVGRVSAVKPPGGGGGGGGEGGCQRSRVGRQRGEGTR